MGPLNQAKISSGLYFPDVRALTIYKDGQHKIWASPPSGRLQHKVINLSPSVL